MRKFYSLKNFVLLASSPFLIACKKETSIIPYNNSTTPVVTTTTPPPTTTSNTVNPFSQPASDADSKALFFYDVQPSSEYYTSTRGYQACPSIGSENGHLFSAWMCGKKTEEPGNYISIAVSDDAGSTWHLNSLIVAPDDKANRHFDSSFWNDKYGNLYLSWTRSDGQWDGAQGGVWRVKIKYVNNKVVITKPVFMFHGDMNVKPTPLGQDSTSLLFPVSGWNINSPVFNGLPATMTLPEYNGAFVYKSTYDPITKELQAPQKVSKIPTSIVRVFDEHMLVNTTNNTFKCMMRTFGNGIASIQSNDNCNSWGSESLFTDLGATTASRFYYARLKSGNILYILNNSTVREKITAYLSKDNGQTFPYKVLIDSRLGSSYPDVVQSADGSICLIYDFSRNPIGEINFVKFTEQDIINGSTANFKRVKICSLQ